MLIIVILYFSFVIVLYPVNLDAEVTILITPGEHSFDRSTFDINILIKQIMLNIDSKQFSDLLDFGKFQNYSTLYGTKLSCIFLQAFFSFFYLERCREYRELHLQEVLDDTKLTPLHRDRLKVTTDSCKVATHPRRDMNLQYVEDCKGFGMCDNWLTELIVQTFDCT